MIFYLLPAASVDLLQKTQHSSLCFYFFEKPTLSSLTHLHDISIVHCSRSVHYIRIPAKLFHNFQFSTFNYCGSSAPGSLNFFLSGASATSCSTIFREGYMSSSVSVVLSLPFENKTILVYSSRLYS